MTEQQQKEHWERGKKVLERIMRHVTIDKLESLAEKIESKDFRASMQYKIFINSLKK